MVQAQVTYTILYRDETLLYSKYPIVHIGAVTELLFVLPDRQLVITARQLVSLIDS